MQVGPDGTFLMPLSSSITVGGDGRTAEQLERESAAVGRAARAREHEIAAVGKTTEQLQREIAALFTRGSQAPEVFVILVAPRSREDLRLEFDNALRAAAARPAEPR